MVKGGGGEVEEETESGSSLTRSIRIFQIILFKMESATLKNHSYFLKRGQLQKRSQRSHFDFDFGANVFYRVVLLHL